jgi:hypothetical protein
VDFWRRNIGHLDLGVGIIMAVGAAGALRLLLLLLLLLAGLVRLRQHRRLVAPMVARVELARARLVLEVMQVVLGQRLLLLLLRQTDLLVSIHLPRIWCMVRLLGRLRLRLLLRCRILHAKLEQVKQVRRALRVGRHVVGWRRRCRW